ncbi:MAG: glycosyltransferase family protein, partial [Planctomycetia bacterium]
FKPQLSLPTLLAANYLTHLSTTRTELARRIGGFREETDGAQDWDFFLRILENSRRVAHIPKILYHWRLWERSVSSGHAAKPYVFEAQKRTLEDHFQRHAGLKVEAEVEVGKQVVYRFKEAAKRSVSVVVQAGRLHENFTALLKTLLAERERLPEGNLEILVAHGGDATAGWRSFYRTLEQDLGVKVVCDAAFPTSWACRNEAARRATGDAVLFLDEDLTPVAAGWLDEMRQWLAYPGVAAVSGCVTGPNGTIERGGWSVGGSELCRPVFGGLPFERWTTFGNTDWMRSHTAFSGDALMVDRQAFLAAGGFDESYGSWGADFDLCLKLHETGATLLYSPQATLRSPAPRPRPVPGCLEDWTRFRDRWSVLLEHGDPYDSRHLNWTAAGPTYAKPADRTARLQFVKPPAAVVETTSARFAVPRESTHEANICISYQDFGMEDLEANRRLLEADDGGPIASVNWFIPGFANAFYGGIHTILRLAQTLRTEQGVDSNFCIVGGEDPAVVRRAVVRAFPGLADAEFWTVTSDDHLRKVRSADACVATLWTTAYKVLKFNRCRRKFYMLQDWEPLFYPAGSISGMVEATLRFGFYGLANTKPLRDCYEQEYNGKATHLTPCVDTDIFHPAEPKDAAPRPHRLFFYGRPDNPRNAFELGTAALRRIKERLGASVEIVSAGDFWRPIDFGLQGVVDNLGCLSLAETADLYRRCDVGLAMMFTRHPSYLPFELMASGCLVVTNHNNYTKWFLRHEDNCLLSEPSVECLSQTIEAGLRNTAARRQIVMRALEEVRTDYSDWNAQLLEMANFMQNPTNAPELPSRLSIRHAG